MADKQVVWAVPVEITEQTLVLVAATSPQEAVEAAERRQWLDVVPRGDVVSCRRTGAPVRQR